MIGNVMKGRGFTGLARYLETGRDENAADRVEWIEARNLPTNDPETASLLMRATAARSTWGGSDELTNPRDSPVAATTPASTIEPEELRGERRFG